MAKCDRWHWLICAGILCASFNATAQKTPVAAAAPSSQEPSPQQQPKAKRVRVSAGVAQAALIRKVNPNYPKDAWQNKVQGIVLLQAVISTTGDIVNLELMSGHPLLAKAAIEAVQQWKYKPYLLKGEPVEVETQVRVIFTMIQ